MLKIYHNPRCKKSREGLEILENSSLKFEVVKYLSTAISRDELTNLIVQLGIPPIELIRKSEKIWKDNYKDKKLSDKELISAMIENPKLIERPIVTNGKKAVIGRPKERILTII
ncbi:arsenate reductase (glutaredoxin) [Polaribacter tangerinus]|uniref:arsenate reductase (glutaredoxin) n=1 Tax=Polaribacter tangerinus TaxID=1920034 RepID=UPI000B4ACAC3|nr:arsenate reductase (glutaredoxin) [Polaribacter tangerinus]